jgi:hypothetical protein
VVTIVVIVVLLVVAALAVAVLVLRLAMPIGMLPSAPTTGVGAARSAAL